MVLHFETTQDFLLLGASAFWLFLLGLIIWKGIYEFYLYRQENKLDQRRKEVEQLVLEMIKNAEKRAESIIKSADQKVQKEMEKVEKLEEKLLKKEEKLEQKIEELEAQKQKLKERELEMEKLINEQKLKLSEIAGLTPEQAKQILLRQIEKEYEEDLKRTIAKWKKIKQEEAQKEAAQILTKVLPRVASDVVSEFTVTTIDLPEESVKWKIIWREWRNIQHFERITGVELIVDDTPLVVRVASYDPEKRFIAAEALKRLIKDWRINPVHITKTYDKVKVQLDDILYRKWEETLVELNLPMMHPDIVKMIWKMDLRYSYGQNLLNHSKEVAKISEIIANELWLDGVLAKKAGLLHDIWKLIAESWEAHAKVGADFLRKYWFNEIIVNAAESHHFDVPLIHPISRIVAAADAISASRPWARFNTKELFIERLANLEKLIMSIPWIEKVYIYQAWRQIIVFVNPQEVSDLELEKMIKQIWEKIEDQLDYPGMIRVIAIRETKVSSYLK